MVVFYLRNSRAPDDKVVPITISLQLSGALSQLGDSRVEQFPLASGEDFPNLLDPEGDQIWTMVVSPPRDELDKDTNQPIPPQIVNIVSEDTLHLEIEAALGRIGSRINWPSILEDKSPPQLFSIEPPLDQNTNVSIWTNNVIRIKEPLPAAGLDLSTLNMKLNGLPVITSGIAELGENVEFRGNIFDFTLIHKPKRVFC